MLATIELIKLKYNLKVSTFFIKSSLNSSADALSRGQIPYWLESRGEKLRVDLRKIEKILMDPITAWKKVLFGRGV